MKLRQRPQLGHDLKVRQSVNIRLANDLVATRLEEEDHAEEGHHTELEAPEPPELEDSADSEAWLDDAPAGAVFDYAWSETLPLISRLPHRLRPQVRYRIDKNLQLHSLSRQTSRVTNLELAIAEAIVQHLRNIAVSFDEPGDWCKIPCIGGDRDLAALVPQAFAQELDEQRLHSLGNILKGFALQLPNQDVITPRALLERARRDKRTTRAAALRYALQRPDRMPDGEEWSKRDWDGFERTQRKKRDSRHKRVPSGETS